MNVYDFDNTIYDADSSIEFYKYCIKIKKKILVVLPKQVLCFILYKLKLIKKNKFKEVYFSFLKYFDNIDDVVKSFWEINMLKITDWYKNKSKNTDVIISASPLFLLKPLEKKLNISKVIATNFDKKTGKILDDNCYGINKIAFFEKYYKLEQINEFYTDSLSDIPMLEVAKNGYLVNNKKNEIKNYKEV